MSINNRDTCSVPGCTGKLDPRQSYNLCKLHMLPGMDVQVGDSTMVITFWRVRHDNEVGIVLLNDMALGELHCGEQGFRATLRAQGFSDIRLLRTPAELEMAKRQAAHTTWGGPWTPRYPWQGPEH